MDRRKFSLVLILVIIFLLLLVLSNLIYEIKPEVNLQIIGSTFGILIGSFLAGSYTLNSVKEQIEYEKKTRKEEKIEIYLKYIRYIKQYISYEITLLREVLISDPKKCNDKIITLSEHLDKVSINLEEINLEYIPIGILKGVLRIKEVSLKIKENCTTIINKEVDYQTYAKVWKDYLGLIEEDYSSILEHEASMKGEINSPTSPLEDTDDYGNP